MVCGGLGIALRAEAHPLLRFNGRGLYVFVQNSPSSTPHGRAIHAPLAHLSLSPLQAVWGNGKKSLTPLQVVRPVAIATFWDMRADFVGLGLAPVTWLAEVHPQHPFMGVQTAADGGCSLGLRRV